MHPLPYVPVHVVQPERIRPKRAHRRRLPAVPTAPAPVAVRAIAADLVSPPVACRGPRSRHVFPLRLAQQPIVLSRLAGQPAYVLLGIVPAHVDDRTRPPAPALVVGIVRAPSGLVARIPLRERHLVHPHRERLREGHQVSGGLVTLPLREGHQVSGAIVTLPIRLSRRRAHHVRPRRHHHHLRALRAVAKRGPRRQRLWSPALPKTGGGQVGQMAVGALRQAHHLDGPGGGHEELPIPRAITQTPIRGRDPARFELLRAERPRRTGRQDKPHSPTRSRLTIVVAPGDRHRDARVSSVDHP